MIEFVRKTSKTSAGNAVESTVWDWLEDFAGNVRSRDFVRARVLFHRDALGFGTVARVANGRAEIEKGQWRRVWTRTSGFRFVRAGSRIELSDDGLLAVVMAEWRACNQAAPKRMVLDRRGRATIVLRRMEVNGTWLAHHTHFSFGPAARQAAR